MSVYWSILVKISFKKEAHILCTCISEIVSTCFNKPSPVWNLTTKQPPKKAHHFPRVGGAPRNPGSLVAVPPLEVVLWVISWRSIRVSRAWPCIPMDYTPLAAPNSWRVWWRMHVTWKVLSDESIFQVWKVVEKCDILICLGSRWWMVSHIFLIKFKSRSGNDWNFDASHIFWNGLVSPFWLDNFLTTSPSKGSHLSWRLNLFISLAVRLEKGGYVHLPNFFRKNWNKKRDNKQNTWKTAVAVNFHQLETPKSQQSSWVKKTVRIPMFSIVSNHPLSGANCRAVSSRESVGPISPCRFCLGHVRYEEMIFSGFKSLTCVANSILIVFFFLCVCFVTILCGGNSTIFYFHPENWGRFPIWLIFFRWVESAN